jgi:hypothetical protein
MPDALVDATQGDVPNLYMHDKDVILSSYDAGAGAPYLLVFRAAFKPRSSFAPIY